ncbi:DNA-binding protein [Spongiactinospora rosea]|uniref:DNA-binding protein n=2 Tax=Spongiactinospora rosea TaxID=2248750 RepID=A0A366M2Q1_9ACTN|nr:DNA-binding protein [Spongiactinospora rosea]
MTPAPAIDQIPAEHRLYRIADAARAIGQSRAKLYQLINAGRLYVVHEGRTALVPGTAIADYIADLKREAGVSAR